jgi:hypothetical protein
MNHLSPDTLLDLAEGARNERAEAHLAACETCRRDCHELGATLALAKIADVPEPSPLFWDHLSSRISEAVAREGKPAPAGWLGQIPWRLAGAAGTLVTVLAVALILRSTPPPPTTQSGAAAPGAEVALAPSEAQATPGDDASLSLLVDLAGDLEWDAAAEAGLTVRGGVAERAVDDLSHDERVTLLRMLRDAMDGKGA